MKLYNVIITNEDSDVVSIQHCITRERAQEVLSNSYGEYREKLKDERITDDNWNPGIAFCIAYGSYYFYLGRIIESEL